jgi:predicted DsbA family dithiol-disulfide isomerase
MTKDITIRIASDYVCPWCLVGHARLEQALKASGLEGRVQIEWLPFELNPSAPAEGLDRKTHLEKKFGGPEKLAELDAKMKEIGTKDGIAFRQELMKRTPNTFNAHRLTWFTAQKYPDKADALAHRILIAYFTQGEDIGDIKTLSRLAGEIGINEQDARTFLNSREGSDEVRTLEEDVRARGITMVPYFTINGEDIRGAHKVEVYVEALQNAAEKAKAA